MAKNIIKDPQIMKEAGQKMNFNRIEIYPFKDYSKELKKFKLESQKNSKVFENFSFKKGDLVKANLPFQISPHLKMTDRSNSINNSVSPRENLTSLGFYPKSKVNETGNKTF